MIRRCGFRLGSEVSFEDNGATLRQASQPGQAGTAQRLARRRSSAPSPAARRRRTARRPGRRSACTLDHSRWRPSARSSSAATPRRARPGGRDVERDRRRRASPAAPPCPVRGAGAASVSAGASAPVAEPAVARFLRSPPTTRTSTTATAATTTSAGSSGNVRRSATDVPPDRPSRGGAGAAAAAPHGSAGTSRSPGPRPLRQLGHAPVTRGPHALDTTRGPGSFIRQEHSGRAPARRVFGRIVRSRLPRSRGSARPSRGRSARAAAGAAAAAGRRTPAAPSAGPSGRLELPALQHPELSPTRSHDPGSSAVG